MYLYFIIYALFVGTRGSLLQAVLSSAVVEDRLAVIKNTRQPSSGFTFAFHTNNGKLRYGYTEKGAWSSWVDLGSPSGTEVISNPASVHDSNNLTKVFCLCGDGQVYSIQQDSQKTTAFGKWTVISSKLPVDKGAVLNGKDNVKVLIYQGKVSVFARTLAKASRLYWTQEDHGNWTSWSLIGGSSVALKTDMAVVYNGFSKYLEAFAVMENKYMYRTWQTSPNKWVSWDKTGYSAPTSVHAPVAHSMSHNFFNGVLNVFIFSEDGYLHHIWQTTCDKLPNPWGWCTWSWWYKIGSAIPKTAESANPLSIGTNIHSGIEVFTVSSDGSLWHLWQLERGSDWSVWEYVGRPQSGPIASHPAIINDDKGWLAAYAVSLKMKSCTLPSNPLFLMLTVSLRSSLAGPLWINSLNCIGGICVLTGLAWNVCICGALTYSICHFTSVAGKSLNSSQCSAIYFSPEHLSPKCCHSCHCSSNIMSWKKIKSLS